MNSWWDDWGEIASWAGCGAGIIAGSIIVGAIAPDHTPEGAAMAFFMICGVAIGCIALVMPMAITHPEDNS